MVTAKEIAEFLDEELKNKDFTDRSNNGLQVENTGDVKKVGFAVDACLESFEKAAKAGCQLLITHHGLIWEGIKYITGINYNRIKALIENNLALYGAHLPLDAHPMLGNNAELASLLEIKNTEPFGAHKGNVVGLMGKRRCTLEDIKKTLEKNGMKAHILPFGKKEVESIAIVSGGGSAEVYEAIEKKADLYITGEAPHFIYQLAKEAKINIILAGHYETEVWGVKALIPLIKKKFGVEVEFIDAPTEL